MGTTRIRFAAFAATAVVVAGAAGCGSGDDGAAGKKDGKEGGTAVIALTSDQQGVDAASLNDVRENVTRQLTDSLVYRNPKTEEYEPWLATKWTVSPDAAQYTFTLRDDVTFNDGTKLTAEVVKANIQALQQPGVHSTPAGLVHGVKVEVLDVHTAKFILPRANAGFLASISRADVGIVSAATAAKPLAGRQKSIDGSGPFTLVSWDANREVVLKRRADYNWAPKSISHDGPAYIEELRFEVIPEDQVIYESLKSGKVDFYENVSPLQLNTLKASGVQISDIIGSPGLAQEQPLNVSNPILRDKRVRQALQYGIDREAINKTTWLGKNQPAANIFARTNPFWTDLGQYLVYDPKKSVALLEEAGWTQAGGDGIRVKDGKRLTLRAAQNSPTVQIEKEAWKKIGVELVIDPPLRAEANQRILTGEYDITYWEQTYPDADILRANYGKTSGSNRSILAPSNTEDAQLDALLEKQAVTSNADQRKQIVDEAATILVRDAYTLAVIERGKVWALGKRLRDVTPNGVDQLFYTAWLSS